MLMNEELQLPSHVTCMKDDCLRNCYMGNRKTGGQMKHLEDLLK